jgi:serine/threonine protein kinase, bacterial
MRQNSNVRNDMRTLRLIRIVLALAVIAAVHLRVLAHPGSGIAVDAQGRVFFTAGPMIVMIETNGVARTIVHDVKNEKFYQLHHIQRAPDGGLLTASDLGNALWRFTPDGTLARFYPDANASKPAEVGVGGDPFAVDRAGNIYAVKSEQYRSTQILKIAPGGQVTVLAGSVWGFADGKGTNARFGDLHGGCMIVAPDGALLLSDNGSRVRRVAPDGTVTTLAGGTNQARLAPAGLAVDAEGNILVVDNGGLIRRILPTGNVETWAGSRNGMSKDGPLLQAAFDRPTGIAIAPGGEVFVLEPDGPRVRKISGGGVITIQKGLP